MHWRLVDRFSLTTLELGGNHEDASAGDFYLTRKNVVRFGAGGRRRNGETRQRSHEPTSGSYRKNEKGARQLVIKLAIFDRSDFQQRFKAPICPARAYRVERLCHLQISFNTSKTVQSYHSSSHCQVKRLRQSLTPAPKQLIAKHRSAPKSSLKLRRVRR